MKVSLLYHLLLGHSRLPLQSHLYKTSAVKGCNSKEVTTLQQHWFCKFIFLKTERLDQLVVFKHSNSFEYFHWSQNFGLGLNSEGIKCSTDIQRFGHLTYIVKSLWCRVGRAPGWTNRSSPLVCKTLCGYRWEKILLLCLSLPHHQILKYCIKNVGKHCWGKEWGVKVS